MSLVKCGECGRDVSDKAAVCVGCGAPVVAMSHGDSQAGITQSRKGLFARLWTGEVPLVQSYWLYGVAIPMVWGVVIGLLSPKPGSLLAKGLVLVLVAYAIFIYIGIWRSADNYTGKATWANLAKAAIVLGTLLFILPSLAAFVF